MEAIIPDEMQSLYDKWKMSPAIACNGLAFLTGFNGAPIAGDVSDDPREQFEETFRQISSVLRTGDMDFGSVIEMTSYHIGIQKNLGLFAEVRGQYVREPYPAWTAIEVSGFASPGVIIEVRIVAKLPT